MAFTAGAAIIGKNRKLYVDVDGSLATPMWVEAGKIQGATKNSSRNVAEIEERAEEDVLVLLGHKSREVTFQLTFRPGDTTYDAIEDAYENGTKLGIAVMSGTITEVGQRGYQAEVYVTQFDDDQANTGSAVGVTVRPCADYVTAPAFVEIAV
ncbi:MAG: hypothetical protein WBC44_03750 [Planctomycetaceae bacterium]